MVARLLVVRLPVVPQGSRVAVAAESVKLVSVVPAVCQVTQALVVQVRQDLVSEFPVVASVVQVSLVSALVIPEFRAAARVAA